MLNNHLNVMKKWKYVVVFDMVIIGMVSIERKVFQRRVFSECESAKEKNSEIILSEENIWRKIFQRMRISEGKK